MIYSETEFHFYINLLIVVIYTRVLLFDKFNNLQLILNQIFKVQPSF